MSPRKILLTLTLYFLGLAIGLIMGVRLGLDSIENNLRNDICNLREDLKFERAEKKCPVLPYPMRDYDLEPEPKIEDHSNPPVNL